MMNILIDTGFWYGLFDKSDQYHVKAQKMLEIFMIYVRIKELR
jgi:predicted nucleic acid-binding protein